MVYGATHRALFDVLVSCSGAAGLMTTHGAVPECWIGVILALVCVGIAERGGWCFVGEAVWYVTTFYLGEGTGGKIVDRGMVRRCMGGRCVVLHFANCRVGSCVLEGCLVVAVRCKVEIRAVGICIID